jgi:hypothetical protein
MGSTGKFLFFAGLAVAAVGLGLIALERFSGVRPGRLPGDIYIERDGWRFYFPIVTSIILSIIISFIMWLFSRK